MKRVLISATLATVIFSAALIPSAHAAPNLTAGERITEWHAGISRDELRQARVVRIPKGFHAVDLATLNDDQMVETPSGRRVSVIQLRTLRQALAKAEARPRAPEQFHLLPPPNKPCAQPRPGETYAQIFTRPDTDVICMRSGASVSVAQLRLMKSYIERTRGLSFSGAVLRPALSGRAVAVTNATQLKTLLGTTLKDSPDSTVLVNAKGERITLGSVRAAVQERPELLTKRALPNGGRR